MTAGTDRHALESCEVLVAGGGMAGVCAAVAAARAGARTLLVERIGFLGGAATAAAVPQFMGWKTAAGGQVIGGIAQEIVDRLVASGGAHGFDWFTMSTGLRMDRLEFDPEVLKVVLDDMVIEAGATPLFHAWTAGAGCTDRRVTRVDVLTKSGMRSLAPQVVIDASGDLDLLHAAGCEMLPLDEDEALQPATLGFRMGPIDFAVLDALEPAQKSELARKGVEEQGLGRFALHYNRMPGTDDAWFNVTRIAVDGTDAVALSRAEMEGRRQALAAARFIARNVPGCGRAKLVALATQIGIRETRRIRGRVVVTEDDLRSGREYPDTVAQSAFPIDLHSRDGKVTRLERVGGEHHAYCVPLRALLPVSVDNALVAGRGISATHVAFAALRVMPTAMATGQAAGIAAALSSQGEGRVASVEFERVRQALLAGGAILG
ncbi:MAG: FAD-dependent oxidoreductase [Burkholderiales bacterium]|nr:FAD-dependent oxidoreductase [Burkholderiales bacterium]OJX08709.1 MAG: FAD-dependent oxidoreductase [Burkholderiales bacterium 70-64]